MQSILTFYQQKITYVVGIYLSCLNDDVDQLAPG